MKTTISASRTSAAIVSPSARPTALDDDVTAALAIPDVVDRTDAALTSKLVDDNNIVVVRTLDE